MRSGETTSTLSIGSSGDDIPIGLLTSNQKLEVTALEVTEGSPSGMITWTFVKLYLTDVGVFLRR
jgi:hypothetical protein